jgi:hypothetical protein
LRVEPEALEVLVETPGARVCLTLPASAAVRRLTEPAGF